MQRRVLIGLLASTPLLTACTFGSSGDFDPVSVDQRAAEAAINEIRRQNGLQELHHNRVLQIAANNQARLMAEADTMSHTVSSGNDFGARIKRTGFSGPAAENLSAGRVSVSSALGGWMRSPGHRENMLNPAFDAYGLAAARVGPERDSRYGIYWAMVLGGPRPQFVPRSV